MAIPITTTGMEGLFGTEFFVYVLPWLFVFAIVYGVLSHIGDKGIPESKPARAIIGMVLAFIVTPILAPWIGSLMEMTGIFMVIIAVFLVFIVLLEILGIKKTARVVTGIDKDGNPKTENKELSIFEAYGVAFAILFIIIAALVFIAAGGLGAIGITIPPIVAYNYPLIFFLIFIALLIWWMSSES